LTVLAELILYARERFSAATSLFCPGASAGVYENTINRYKKMNKAIESLQHLRFALVVSQG
jgi:hypothetical protein